MVAACDAWIKLPFYRRFHWLKWHGRFGATNLAWSVPAGSRSIGERGCAAKYPRLPPVQQRQRGRMFCGGEDPINQEWCHRHKSDEKKLGRKKASRELPASSARNSGLDFRHFALHHPSSNHHRLSTCKSSIYHLSNTTRTFLINIRWIYECHHQVQHLHCC